MFMRKGRPSDANLGVTYSRSDKTSCLWDFQERQGSREKTKNVRPTINLFVCTVPPPLKYTSETTKTVYESLRKQDEHEISVVPGRIESTTLGMTRFMNVRNFRSSELRQQSKIRDAVAWIKSSSKLRWADHVCSGFRRQPLVENRPVSSGCPKNIRSSKNVMVGHLRGSPEQTIRCCSRQSRRKEALGYFGTRQERKMLTWCQFDAGE